MLQRSEKYDRSAYSCNLSPCRLAMTVPVPYSQSQDGDAYVSALLCMHRKMNQQRFHMLIPTLHGVCVLVRASEMLASLGDTKGYLTNDWETNGTKQLPWSSRFIL